MFEVRFSSSARRRKVRIHTKKGAILGVLGKKPIHLIEPGERNKVAAKSDLWIDIGANDGKETKKLEEIGDPITYDDNFEMLRGNLAVSRAFDNKMGAYLAAETLRLRDQLGNRQAAHPALARSHA